MNINEKEHYELMAQFEKDMARRGFRFDKEEKSLWTAGSIYQHGETNNAFLIYRIGYSFGRVVERME